MPLKLSAALGSSMLPDPVSDEERDPGRLDWTNSSFYQTVLAVCDFCPLLLLC